MMLRSNNTKQTPRCTNVFDLQFNFPTQRVGRLAHITHLVLMYCPFQLIDTIKWERKKILRNSHQLRSQENLAENRGCKQT